MSRSRAAGWAASVILHMVLLVTAGGAWVESAGYGVESGMGGVEVNLIAAPPTPSSLPFLEETKTAVVEPKAQTEPGLMPAPVEPTKVFEQSEPDRPKVVPARAAKPAQPSDQTGDGSSPVPGHDKTTLRSGHSAVSDAKPMYLKNPAPAYPEAARSRGVEGTVVLSVSVDRAGMVAAVKVERSSGRTILDRSAVAAVERWQFRPASIAGVAVESLVEVPIRFALKTDRAELGV